jgi:hypothetical protein
MVITDLIMPASQTYYDAPAVLHLHVESHYESSRMMTASFCWHSTNTSTSIYSH